MPIVPFNDTNNNDLNVEPLSVGTSVDELFDSFVRIGCYFRDFAIHQTNVHADYFPDSIARIPRLFIQAIKMMLRLKILESVHPVEDEIREFVESTQQDLKKLCVDFQECAVWWVQLFNYDSGDGTVRPWFVVSFPNGERPIEPPHNLPRVANINDLLQLNESDLVSYLVGYGAEVPQSDEARRRRLCESLGVDLSSFV
jgi:hypothetical protein